MFCYPENIEGELRKLFGRLAADDFLRDLSAAEFARHSAHIIAELNAIHPFREGNGRTQLTYLSVLAEHARHPLQWKLMEPSELFDAIVMSFTGDEAPLAHVIEKSIEP